MKACLRLTIIVPAFNEEAWLAPTLDSVHAAAERLCARSRVDLEMIVVDNNSDDGTATVARSRGVTVVHEPVQGIARARNTGARHATGDVLVFVDADVIVPRTLLEAIDATMSDPKCIGGGVDIDYRPRHAWVGLYLRAWRFLGNLMGMVQGAAQFCRKSVFEQVGGYDEKVWMDRRRRRLLLAPPRTGQGKPSHGPAHSRAARATLLQTLRPMAAVEDPALDQSSLHRAVPALETGLEGLVLGSGAIGP